jgi:hypothetical protein
VSLFQTGLAGRLDDAASDTIPDRAIASSSLQRDDSAIAPTLALTDFNAWLAW